MTLRIEIRPLRHAKGWTQQQLADAAGVQRVTVTRIEQGRARQVALDTLERLADALGVAPGLLLVKDGDRKSRR